MNDLEFIQRCVQGDKHSWDEFVDKYSRLIYNYIYSVLKVKGSIIAQENINDLFQEIFLALIKDNFKKLKSFKAKNGCSFASWLRQVVINATIDYLRRLKTLVSLDAETDEEFSLKDILVNNSVSASETLNQEERLARLKGCIDKLNTDDKYFLELYLNKGFKPEELKDVLWISRAAVDMRKSRIIERLKDCFEAQGFALDF